MVVFMENLLESKISWDDIDAIWNEVAVLVCNPHMPDCPIIFVNDKFLEHSGYSREDIIGRNCRFMQGPETEPEGIEDFRSAIKNKENKLINITNYTKNNEVFKNQVLIAPVKSRNGDLTLFVAVQRKLL